MCQRAWFWEGIWCYAHGNEGSSLLHRGSKVVFESPRFFVSHLLHSFFVSFVSLARPCGRFAYRVTCLANSLNMRHGERGLTVPRCTPPRHVIPAPRMGSNVDVTCWAAPERYTLSAFNHVQEDQSVWKIGTANVVPIFCWVFSLLHRSKVTGYTQRRLTKNSSSVHSVLQLKLQRERWQCWTAPCMKMAMPLREWCGR